MGNSPIDINNFNFLSKYYSIQLIKYIIKFNSKNK